MPVGNGFFCCIKAIWNCFWYSSIASGNLSCLAKNALLLLINLASNVIYSTSLKYVIYCYN
nr:MAG TPA: hypothetical protein [Caudoviricetes sp.]